MAEGRESVVTQDETETGATRVVLVAGPSGSGRTTAIAALEDLGYETIHNLPLSLVPRLVDGPLERPLALGLDVRSRDFSVARLIELIDRLTRDPALKLEVLYLDSQPDVLIRPPIDGIGVLDFTKARDILTATASVREDVKAAVGRRLDAAA